MIDRLPPKTFADYAAIAVCPVLIMLAVGSLIFFMLAVGYSGSHGAELRWTLFWFVLAMVLVSRIAIERGSEHAGAYGMALAGATALMLTRYIGFNPGVFCLLGLIWWATNKLTWDCTVIDEEQDASGEGLLQTTKLAAKPSEDELAREEKAPDKSKPAKISAAVQRLTTAQADSRKPHAPGVWVIYFSLGALPVFGLGQALMPKQDVAGRQYGFYLLVAYLGAVLGLLLITSFLGLRRYLRQRHLNMPPAMAANWLSTGAILGVGILAGCLLLPLPSASWTLGSMIDRLGDRPAHTTNERGSGNTPGNKLNDKDGTASRPQNQGASGSNAAEPRPDASKPSSAESKPDQSQTATASQRPGDGARPEGVPRPLSRLPVREVLQFLRMVIYVALLVLGVRVLIRSRQWLLKALLEFWHSLRDLWNSIFGGRAGDAPVGVPAVASGRACSRAALKDPFASGAAAQMSIEDLIVDSFNGMESWAEAHHFGRHPEQTPFEFAEQIAREAPDLAHEAEEVTRLYVQVAYAKAAALPASRTMLEILWSKMMLLS